MTRQHVTVALNGDGGDEMFGGYDRYRLLPAYAALGRVPGLGGLGRGLARVLDGHLPVRPRRFLEALSRRPEESYGRTISYFTPEQKVYIVYGDNDYFDDDIDTDPTGLFVFSWLREGTYTIFTYSDCPTCPSSVEVVKRTVTIGDNKEVVDAGTFNVEKW